MLESVHISKGWHRKKEVNIVNISIALLMENNESEKCIKTMNTFNILELVFAENILETIAASTCKEYHFKQTH